jgi:hypothetical protein
VKFATPVPEGCRLLLGLTSLTFLTVAGSNFGSDFGSEIDLVKESDTPNPLKRMGF